MDATAQKFLGAWKFVSSIQTMADGTFYGLTGQGNIIYTPEGRMMVFIMDPARTPFADEARPADAELRAAWRGMLAYGGRFEVNAVEGFVLHHVDLEPSPGRVGITHKRFFQFEGDRLILKAAPPLPEGVVEYTITWQRLPAA
jgi:hypothetical protein